MRVCTPYLFAVPQFCTDGCYRVAHPVLRHVLEWIAATVSDKSNIWLTLSVVRLAWAWFSGKLSNPLHSVRSYGCRS